jgi:hypothetical protein
MSNDVESVSSAPLHMKGTIDPAALVRGKIVSMGEGSVIEAGAMIHHSCRLILGARRERPGNACSPHNSYATRNYRIFERPLTKAEGPLRGPIRHSRTATSMISLKKAVIPPS